MIYSHKDYEAEPFLATGAIGNLLRRGCLNLFLGSGVSAGFGLPEWARLVARLLGRGDDDAYLAELRTKSDKDMGKLLDTIDDETRKVAYLSAVHKALYADVKATLLEQLTQSPLLLAVAALTTGSCRGRVERVFTYNYDDLLEQYLGMLGLGVCIRKAPSEFSTKADVEINHVHGCLPQSWTADLGASELILSGKSYRDRRSEIDSGWSSCVENSMYTKAALLLGLSADDSAVLDVFNRAKKRLARADDYHGYWLLTPDAYARNATEVLGVGMCPIRVEKQEMPKFVFRVCQNALPQR